MVALISGRLAQGVGAALLLPSSLALLVAACPAHKRSQTVALWSGVAALAVAVGPALGALLISSAGWRSAFYVNLPVAAVACLMGRRYLPPEGTAPRLGAPDYVGVLLVSFSLAGLVLAISEGPQWGWADPRVLTSAGLAVGLGAVFIRRCGRHPEPAVDLQLFRSRSFTVANAATMAYAMGFFSMLLGGVLFLTGIWHYSILAAGLGLTPAPIVVALISGPAGRLAALIGFRPVIVAGSIIFVGRLVLVRRRPRPRSELRRRLAARHPRHRDRHWSDIPGAQRRGCFQPACRPVCGRERHQPDQPSSRRRSRRGHPRRHPRR